MNFNTVIICHNFLTGIKKAPFKELWRNKKALLLQGLKNHLWQLN
ncbi:hypothetical protein J605_2317 [Acinetobacter baumannii 1412924]|nr:hypothetical protein J605_2317 [Acinetobacter baumannii 1412924]